MKVLVADKFEEAGVAGLRGLGAEVRYEPGLGTEKLPAAIETFRPDVLVVRSTKVPASVIERASGVRLIVRAGSGVDNIDVAAASARAIAVCNCPGMNAVAVAELTIALLLECDRRMADQVADLRAGRWNKKEYSKARGLKGQTLGVVGVGHIGQEVIKRARAFSMHVVVWSRGITPQHAAALECEWGGVDTPALLALARRADAITVHLPLTPTTKALFNESFFAAMKPGSYFVNTSRGGVVDEAALRAAVKSKGIRAGLDVWDPQPVESEGPFTNETGRTPGVFGTHHCGASTDQAQNAVAMETVRVVRLFKQERRLENCVNAEAVEG